MSMVNSAPCLKAICPSLSSSPHSPRNKEFLTTTASWKRGLKWNIISVPLLCRCETDEHCKLTENLQTHHTITFMCTSQTTTGFLSILKFLLLFPGYFISIFCPHTSYSLFYVSKRMIIFKLNPCGNFVTSDTPPPADDHISHTGVHIKPKMLCQMCNVQVK